METDVLSEVLRVVQLDTAFFFNAEFSAPWKVQATESHEVAPHLSPDAKHLIIFHLITGGTGYVRLGTGRKLSMVPGDVLTFPHGDAHVIGNGDNATPTDTGKILEHARMKKLQLAQLGGGGEVTSVVCGFLGCEPRLSQILLGGLPQMIKVNIRGDASGMWLENSIRFSVTQTGELRAGNRAVLAKLSETLFVETLRRYIEELPDEDTGWLAGVRNPEVGRALALLHKNPERTWTIAKLAQEVGISRAVLAQRFGHYLGMPPMSYLAQWRLQLGARMLTNSGRGVADIAAEVGYESEAAFNRAFKRQFGLPPGRYRVDSKHSQRAP